MLKVFFWLFVAIDVAALLVFALLGLAAAKPSHTNPIAALIIPFFIPAAILLSAMVLFFKVPSSGARALAVLIAALPLLVIVGSAASSFWELRGFRDASGNIREFRSAALRDIETAIIRNDAAAVSALALEADRAGTDLDTAGVSGATVLVLALRQLEETPGQLDVVKALLAAGADPDASGVEPPLQIAIAASRGSGVVPLQLLLNAGADPNVRDEWGKPAFFMAGGQNIDVAIMALLLAHGADVNVRDEQGGSAVVVPAQTRNWRVLELLLRHGAPWRDQQGIQGVPFLEYMEGEAREAQRRHGQNDGLAEVMAIIRSEVR